MRQLYIIDNEKRSFALSTAVNTKEPYFCSHWNVLGSYTAPDGTLVEMKFVANENGFQPESSLLPVAPEFPHPIPQFVLDQIAFAAEQDAARARGDLDDSDELPYSYS